MSVTRADGHRLRALIVLLWRAGLRVSEALALRSRLLGCFERASLTTDSAARRRLLTFAVVGAGPTGVEYSGAVAELIKHVLPKDYRRIDFAEVSVVLIEAGERVLATFAPRLSRLATRSLERKGVRVILGESVREKLRYYPRSPANRTRITAV